MSIIKNIEKQSSFESDIIELNESMNKSQVEEELVRLFEYDLFRFEDELYQTKDIKKILVTKNLGNVTNYKFNKNIIMFVCITVLDFELSVYFDGNFDEVQTIKVYKKGSK